MNDATLRMRGRFEAWKRPEPGRRYLISIDTAEGLGEGGDWTYGVGLDERTFEHVFSFSTQLREGPTADKVYSVACDYNDARIVIERNKGMALIASLEALPTRLRARPVDGQTHHPRARVFYDHDEKPGVFTSATLRPVLFSTLDEAIRNGTFKTSDAVLLAQLRAIVTDQKTGRPTAPDKKRKGGLGDDGVLAAAIGVYVLMQGGASSSVAESGGDSYGFGGYAGRGY